jgi:hypothetical protein
MYRDEKKLFQAGAKATLQGTNSVVNSLSYDDETNKLDVATPSGTTTFMDLLPLASINNSDVGTSDNHISVDRVGDHLLITTDAETVFVKPEERM